MMRCERLVAVLVLPVLLAACTAGRGPRIETFPRTDTRPVAHIAGVFAYSTALATIGHLFAREFRFPPFEATLVFYPDEKAVEAALLASGHEPALARDGASRLRAIAAHRRVIVNESKMRDAEWPEQVASLTHELVHCLQYELGGGVRGRSEQWLREGFAEWIGLAVLERLRAIEPGDRRRIPLQRLRDSDTARAPRLDEMMTFAQWVMLGGDRSLAPQAQATLAVDLLIQSHGIDAVVGYFRLFAARQDPVGNFAAAFGTDRATFEQTLNRALRLRRAGRGGGI